MKFLKYILFILASFVINSCTNDEDEKPLYSDRPIAFSFYGADVTRAGVDDYTYHDLPTNYQVYMSSLYGFKDANDHVDNKWMKKNLLKHNGEKWITSDIFNWPMDGTMDFMGYGSLKEIPTDMDHVIINMHMDEDDPTMLPRFNSLLMRFGNDGLDGKNDVIYGKPVTEPCSGAYNVNMKFYHALSRVEFKLLGNDDSEIGTVISAGKYTGAKEYVTVNKITFGKVKLSGQMKVTFFDKPANIYLPDVPLPEWTVMGPDHTIEFKKDQRCTSTPTVYDWILLPTGGWVGEDISLTIDYTLHIKDGAEKDVVTAKRSEVMTLPKPLPSLTPGTCYSYTVKILVNPLNWGKPTIYLYSTTSDIYDQNGEVSHGGDIN